jgi:PST family polysaccharide transporter
LGTVVAVLIGVQWGIVGVAIAFVIRELILLPITFVIYQHIVSSEKTNYLNQIYTSISSGLIMGLLIGMFQTVSKGNIGYQLSLFLMVGIGIFIYGFVLNRLDPAFPKNLLELSRYLVPKN